MSDKPEHWPKDVHRLDVEGLEKLGANSRNELFWDGKRLVTRLHLTWPQRVIAFLAAIASLATIATGLNNASIFLCGRGIGWLGCPHALPVPATTAPVAAPPDVRRAP